MRLCTFCVDGGEPRAGVVRDELVLEIDSPAPGGSTDPLRELIAADAFRDGLDERRLGEARPLAEVSLLPPVVRPGKFICIGLNYRSHAEEAGMEVPEIPTFFVKLPNAMLAPGAEIPMPRVSHRIDWEGELAFVIGRRCRHVSRERALEHLFGYTIHNDVTARDLQFKTSQWIVGKTLDGFAPTGPWITTADEVGDASDLRLVTTVGGAVMQDARTSDQIFGVPELVEFLSSLMTLEPGDIVATGTPAGIGASMRPRRWLVPGDEVSVTIEQLGTLTNRMGALDDG